MIILIIGEIIIYNPIESWESIGISAVMVIERY